MDHTRSSYSGREAKLVIAIDVGTTYSGASYTFLIPDQIPKIYDVRGYKGQEDKQSNSKVPSVLLYSHEGELLACGAETVRFSTHEFEGIRTEWFKLELRPPSMRVNAPLVTLPPHHTIIDVFGEFLNHPNGWGPNQQGEMRKAAIRGGLVPDTAEGRERIEFVTEGEASFHWCIDQAIPGTVLEEGVKIVVADLGGGTIDVSSFSVTRPKPLGLQELRPAECALAGSITVTDRFMNAATARLQYTLYGAEEYRDTLREDFDKKTKCLFQGNTNSKVYVSIAGRRDNFEDENGGCKIKYGKLEVPRQDIEDAFEPSVAATVDAIQAHLTGLSDAYVFLVGGFSASNWMFEEIKRRLDAAAIKCQVKRAESDMAKAAAYGGVAFYLDRHVTERVMRHTYGVIMDVPYHSEDPEHEERSENLKTDPISGRQFVRDGFFAIVTRGQLVKVDKVYKERARSDARRKLEPARWSQTIHRYSGDAGNVTFVDMDPQGFKTIGSFSCELPESAMNRRIGKDGAFWAVDLNVVITLGTVEIKAYVEWEENGIKKKTQAESFWEEDYY